MTWDKGFNFRATSTYVTDGTNETYVLAEAYPTTRNGVTFGYTSSPGAASTRDRSTTIGPELAGLHFDGGSGSVFRVDLPAAGDYDVHFAAGDPGNDQTITASFKDGATTLASFGPTAVATAHDLDATGTIYTNAAWPGSNAPRRVTLTGTSFTLTATPSSTIQHLFLSQVSTGASASGAVTLPHLTASGSATVAARASGSATLPHLTAAGTAQSLAKASGAAQLPHLAASGTATSPHQASGSVTLPHLTASGTATLGNIAHAVGAVALPHLTASGAAQSLARAGGAVSLPHFVATGAAAALAKASGVAVLPMFRLVATGHVQPVGAHDAALVGQVTVRARLTGRVATSPQLSGIVAARPRLTGTLTIRPG